MLNNFFKLFIIHHSRYYNIGIVREQVHYYNPVIYVTARTSVSATVIKNECALFDSRNQTYFGIISYVVLTTVLKVKSVKIPAGLFYSACKAKHDIIIPTVLRIFIIFPGTVTQKPLDVETLNK